MLARMESLATPATGMPRTRWPSIDVLRGLAVAGMILVNHPGDMNHVYDPLSHADWNGFSPADLVFPLFIFVLGMSVWLSLGVSRSGVVPPRPAPWRKILRRTALLVLLGLALNVVHGLPYFDLLGVRIPGILQRIAVCYLATAALVLLSSPAAQLGVALGLLVLYTLLLRYVPIAGQGVSDLDVPEATISAHVDRFLFGTHLWKQTWDPEGVLSTLPAIANSIAGALAAAWMTRAPSSEARMRGLKAGAAAALLASACAATVVPVNKNLWTASFALLTIGLSLLTLLVCMALVERAGTTGIARPLLVLGSNPLAIYIGSEVIDQLLAVIPRAAPGGSIRDFLFGHLFASWAPPQLASFAYAAVYLAIWIGVASHLHRRGVVVRI